MKKKAAAVYQFNITLQDVKLAVWRRIQTPDDYSFWDLHVAIQDAMGWNDTHLHEFQIVDPKTGTLESIGIPGDGDLGDDKEVTPGWERPILNYFSAGTASARYVYDFGDDWNHAVVLEESLPADNGLKYPICIDGRGACPPEDCGGPFGYAEFLRAIKKPGSPRGGELLEWVGGSFDSHKFESKDVVFDDPEARWAWTFDGAALLENEIIAMTASPRKPDRQGRIKYRMPSAQCGVILEHPTGLSADLLERFEKADTKDDVAAVSLDIEELKALVRFLASTEKKMPRRLHRRTMQALRDYFMRMESLIRDV